MKLSAGFLLYRRKNDDVEVLLVHPGGPYWKNKDKGSWGIPKGEAGEGEDLRAAAEREFWEETSMPLPKSDSEIELTPRKITSDKKGFIWAFEADLDVSQVKSQTIEIEWPPRSGQKLTVPENDKTEWFPLAVAKQKLFIGQVPFIEELAEKLGVKIKDVGPMPAGSSKAKLSDKQEVSSQTSLF